MAEDWTNVRITKRTAKRLMELIARADCPLAQACAIFPPMRSETRSWDWAITTLLDRDERHRAAARRQRRKRAAPKGETPQRPV